MCSKRKKFAQTDSALYVVCGSVEVRGGETSVQKVVGRPKKCVRITVCGGGKF